MHKNGNFITTEKCIKLKTPKKWDDGKIYFVEILNLLKLSKVEKIEGAVSLRIQVNECKNMKNAVKIIF